MFLSAARFCPNGRTWVLATYALALVVTAALIVQNVQYQMILGDLRREQVSMQHEITELTSRVSSPREAGDAPEATGGQPVGSAAPASPVVKGEAAETTARAMMRGKALEAPVATSQAVQSIKRPAASRTPTRRLGVINMNVVAHDSSSASVKTAGCVSVDNGAAAVTLDLNSDSACGSGGNTYRCPPCFIVKSGANNLCLQKCSTAIVAYTGANALSIGSGSYTQVAYPIMIVNTDSSSLTVQWGTTDCTLGSAQISTMRSQEFWCLKGLDNSIGADDELYPQDALASFT